MQPINWLKGAVAGGCFASVFACAQAAPPADAPPAGAMPPGAMGAPPPGTTRFGMRGPSRPAQQTRWTLHVDGISAVQLAWWFQHLGDEQGRYWKPLAAANLDIAWRVNPREDAHELIGALFTSDQRVAGGLFRQKSFLDQLDKLRKLR